MTPITAYIAEVRERVAKATKFNEVSITRDLSTVQISLDNELWLKLESDDYGDINACSKLSQRYIDAELIACAPTDLDKLTTALELAVEALNKIEKHDGHRHSIDQDELANGALKQIEEVLK